ncbi:P-loop containing nucleoside triphosphate hydrolase protein [Dioscorea alata]|uniref:P-loop containing nucleoside triphosphate hydrolase protein n=1 Tax=Dioscorea alata TaxID=55571 RepID=A0ACB7VRL5_DIOAL|nr:P-loop containing nucleoside triphosphate hydrolase protein [Dioscorea alata]
MAVEAILVKVLGLIIELTAPPVLQYLRPIWGGVDEELEKLRRYLVQIQPLVEDAEERQLVDQNVKSWLMLLKDAAYDAEDILDQANTHVLLIQRKAEFYGPLKSKVRDFFSLHHNPLLFQLQLGDKLRSINQRIHGIIVEMREFNFKVADNNNKNDRPWRNRPQTHSYVPESEVIGRDEDKEQIVQMLIHDHFEEKVAVVSIVGMGGLGKTTLAQLIYGDENVKNHFQLCIWVCVSDDFDVAKLAGNIIHTASGKFCDHSNMEVLQQDLRQVLGQKRYLLVLDDVWNEDHMKWDALRHLLVDGAEGSRILVTTRNENCSRIMGAKKSCLLQGLSEESSWALFERTAFTTSVSRQPKFLEIGKNIVNKCKGLPLAIQVMGSLMQSKIEESQWQAVLDNEIWDIPRATDKIRPELWLSYVNLPSEVKKCFAFCALFPKDSVIEVDMLVQFWIAHGFIPSQTGKDIDVEGHEIFNELIWRSLLQNVTNMSAGFTHYFGSDSSFYDSDNSHERRVCKMHDLIHDLAQFVTGDECSTLPERNKFKKISKRTRHFILNDDVEYDMSDHPSVRTALNVGIDFIGLSKLKLLRVLKLPPVANVDKLLSTSIEYLHHLRYLSLSGTDIKELPESICMLVNLQTLNLNYCSLLTKLPMSIVYMNSLRHLHLNDCPELKIMPSGLSRLCCLKTLTKYIVAEKAGNKIGELKHWNHLEGELGLYDLHEVKNADEAKEANMSSRLNINSLSLSWGLGASVENAEQVLEALKPHAALEVLSLHDYPGAQFSVWIRDEQQLQNLVEIELEGCSGCEQLPSLEQLPYLKKLTVSRMDGIKYIINNTTSDALSLFPALMTLHLYKMANLERWCVEEDRETAPPMFLRLKNLVISRCPKLTTMPPQIPTLKFLDIEESYHGTQIELMSKEKGFFKHLKSLEVLFLKRCEELALLLEDKEETRPLSSSLHRLIIRDCSQFSSSTALRNLTSLKNLQMIDLEELSSWPDEMLRDSESLRWLRLSLCKNLTGASSQGDCGPPFLENLNVSNCDALIELPKCPTSLKTLSVDNCPSIKSLCSDMGHLISLSLLNLSKCPKLESLPEGMRGLTSLQYLFIEDCPALKSFPEGLQQRLPTLKRLEISGCPKLERRCSPGGDYFDLVSSIPKRCINSSPRRILLAPCI